MTKFTFRLARVLEFRRLRAQVLRATLERLHAERIALESREQALLDLRTAEELAIRRPGTSLSVIELSGLGRMQAYVEYAKAGFARERTELERRIHSQQAAVVEADRQVSLLEKLEGRQKAEWQIQFDRELEELAADSYRSRMHRAAGSGGAH